MIILVNKRRNLWVWLIRCSLVVREVFGVVDFFRFRKIFVGLVLRLFVVDLNNILLKLKMILGVEDVDKFEEGWVVRNFVN